MSVDMHLICLFISVLFCFAFANMSMCGNIIAGLVTTIYDYYYGDSSKIKQFAWDDLFHSP